MHTCYMLKPQSSLPWPRAQCSCCPFRDLQAFQMMEDPYKNVGYKKWWPGCRTVWMGNLKHGVNLQEVIHILESAGFGPIESFNGVNDRFNKDGTPGDSYVVITFKTEETAKRSLILKDQMFMGYKQPIVRW